MVFAILPILFALIGFSLFNIPGALVGIILGAILAAVINPFIAPRQYRRRAK